MVTTTNPSESRWAPVTPTWRRLTVLASLALLGWALLVPAGHQPLWWHYLIGVAVLLVFLGSWHSQHISTAVRRWVPLALHNRRLRVAATQPSRRRSQQQPTHRAPNRDRELEAHIVIHLRPHPHALVAAIDATDQLPWDFVTKWLNRYGIRADELAITAVTRTPPPSGLRADAAALLPSGISQHRDTWLTYTLRAESNVAALTARQSTLGRGPDRDADNEGPDGDGPGSDLPRRAALADTTARRLIAELREQGWLATLVGPSDPLPRFVPATATMRREAWTATEYSDGFRAVYAVDPNALPAVLTALPGLATKATWTTVTIRSRGRQPASITSYVATLTSTLPSRRPLPGLEGFHGLHRQVAAALAVGGSDRDSAVDLPAIEVDWADLSALRWPTSATGVPLGFNRDRHPVYLGLASPEPVRITVTGTDEFHIGVVARLALSGLPVALHLADPSRWAKLAHHGATQQFSTRSTPPAGAIVVTDGSSEAPAGAVIVVLRPPQSQPPSTTVVITQDEKNPSLFQVTTPRDSEMLSTRAG